MNKLIDMQDAIDALYDYWSGSSFDGDGYDIADKSEDVLSVLPSAEPEIIRCKCCEYGDQDEAGRWFCRSLGCQIGDEDGSGFCADAERRKDA